MNIHRKIVLAVYRELIKLGRQYDLHPFRKSFIVKPLPKPKHAPNIPMFGGLEPPLVLISAPMGGFPQDENAKQEGTLFPVAIPGKFPFPLPSPPAPGGKNSKITVQVSGPRPEHNQIFQFDESAIRNMMNLKDPIGADLESLAYDDDDDDLNFGLDQLNDEEADEDEDDEDEEEGEDDDDEDEDDDDDDDDDEDIDDLFDEENENDLDNPSMSDAADALQDAFLPNNFRMSNPHSLPSLSAQHFRSQNDSSDNNDAIMKYYNEFFHHANANHYIPSSPTGGSGEKQLTDIIRREFREHINAPLSEQSKLLDVSFTFLRKLNETNHFIKNLGYDILDEKPVKINNSINLSDKQFYDSKDRLARPTKELKPGTLLVAHPFHPNMGLHFAVILVTHHSEEGTHGIFLNNPSTGGGPFTRELVSRLNIYKESSSSENIIENKSITQDKQKEELVVPEIDFNDNNSGSSSSNKKGSNGNIPNKIISNNNNEKIAVKNDNKIVKQPEDELIHLFPHVTLSQLKRDEDEYNKALPYISLIASYLSEDSIDKSIAIVDMMIGDKARITKQAVVPIITYLHFHQNYGKLFKFMDKLKVCLDDDQYRLVMEYIQNLVAKGKAIQKSAKMGAKGGKISEKFWKNSHKLENILKKWRRTVQDENRKVICHKLVGEYIWNGDDLVKDINQGYYYLCQANGTTIEDLVEQSQFVDKKDSTGEKIRQIKRKTWNEIMDLMGGEYEGARYMGDVTHIFKQNRRNKHVIPDETNRIQVVE